MAQETLKSFQRERQTPEERMALGKSVRSKTPRSSLGDYKVQLHRSDVLKILKAQTKDRFPDLIPIRHARMAKNPFAFFRGGAAIMARDLAPLPSPAITVQLCGDMHISNFGFFSTTEQRLVFGINDFDETFPGNFDWDLKRLAASAMIAAKHLGQNESYGEELVRRIAKSYRNYMFEYAQTPYIELIRASYLDEKNLIAHVSNNGFSEIGQRYLQKQISKAQQNNNQGVLGKITQRDGDQVKIIDNPPFVSHLERNLYGAPLIDVLDQTLEGYKKSLRPDYQQLLQRYRVVDYARKVVGIGSVGLGCWILYMEGLDEGDPLFLQFKRALPSVLAPYFPRQKFTSQSKRVVYGQQLIQGAPDIFLGYSGVVNNSECYIRQLRDMKGGISIGTDKGDIGIKELPDFASLFGWAIANAHARSGDPAVLAGYCGKSEQLDDALVRFAKTYTEQNDSDYEVFMEAIRCGSLPCAEDGY